MWTARTELCKAEMLNPPVSQMWSGHPNTALAAAPLCSFIYLERDRVLGWVFNDVAPGGATLAWFAAAFFISIIGAPAITSLSAVGVRQASVAMWSSVIGFAVAIAIWIVFRSGGVSVGGFGYLIGSMIQVAPPLAMATRRFDVNWRTFPVRAAALMLAIPVLSLSGPSFTVDIMALGVTFALLLPEGWSLFNRQKRAH